MRIMALVLASALAVCFTVSGSDMASAATKRSAANANPDRSVYPNSAGCGTTAAYCYRSGSQKKKHKKK